ncbi:MAG: sulfite exporter TauE/SafE family protein [Chloroflexi bacterium]|nr:sulfite exporter TauE/SafE family protein [Chloroflexota bacterium]
METSPGFAAFLLLQLPNLDWHLPLTGFIVGLVIGMTGMGGGVIMTPLLMLGFGLPPSLAVGTDLVYAAVTKLAGFWQHWRQRTVDFGLVRDLALGSLPASLAAVELLAWLKHTYPVLVDTWLGRLIAVALILAGLLMVFRVLHRHAPSPLQPARPYRRWTVVAIGALGGLLVGLTSVGSGTMIMALLVLLVPLSSEKLVGTDIAHATLLVGVSALAHLILGDANLPLAGQLLLGSIPGVLIGSRLTLAIPRPVLQVSMASLLITAAVVLLR